MNIHPVAELKITPSPALPPRGGGCPKDGWGGLKRSTVAGALLAYGFLISVMPLCAKASGSSTANFLKLGAGGRGVAMGEAQTAAVDDIMSLYWNPAGLGYLYQNEVGFMHNNLIQGISQDVFYYARPTDAKGTFGAGLSMLRTGDITGYDSADLPTGNVQSSDMLLTAGWGKSMDQLVWFRDMRVGANLKILRKTLDQDSALGYMVDLGALYESRGGWLRGLNTGFVIQNLGTGLSFGGEKAGFPLQMKLGLAYPMFGDNLALAADFVLPTDANLHMNMGADYRVWDILAFRVGLKGAADLDSGITYGVRLGNERLHMDYAFVPYGPFGDSHRVSLGFRFGKAYREGKVADQLQAAYLRAEAKYGQGYLVDAYMQATQVLDVAPWHRQAKLLTKRIQSEFKQMENEARRQQLQAQVDEHFARGEQLFQIDDLLHAKREFEGILALQADHMGAKTYLNRIEERFKSIVDSFYEAAMRSFAAGDYKQSQDYLQRVLIVNPEHSDAREQLARVEILLDKQAKAMEDQQRLERIRPLRQAAMIFFEQRQYEDALSKFEEVLTIDTTDAEALRYRGISRSLIAKESFNAGMKFGQEGKFPEARQHLERALRYDRDNPDILKAYNSVKDRQLEKDRLESQRIYRDALDAFLAGDLEKALQLSQKSIEFDSDNLEAKRLVERLLQKRGTTAP